MITIIFLGLLCLIVLVSAMLIFSALGKLNRELHILNRQTTDAIRRVDYLIDRVEVLEETATGKPVSK